jgi:hypothetical protein
VGWRFCTSIAFAAVAVTACSDQHTVPYHMRDQFHACVAPDGHEYMVEYEDGDCRPGDVAKRCLTPNGVVDVRAVSAQQDCSLQGGRLLGLPTTQP